jgi:hypothetical protein
MPEAVLMVSIRRLAAAVSLIVAASTSARCGLVQDVGCEGDSVLHPPAGVCIISDELLLTSPERDAVQAAVAPFGGQVVVTTLRSYHFVRFPVDSLLELDGIKEELNKAGWDVQYHIVGSNSRDP